jgi:hypothetical protein
VQLGDEPTKFFHAAATERYRLNTIKYIKDDEGRDLSEHEEKVVVLWNTYRRRMGESSNTKNLFQIQSLVSNQMDLSHLVEPFTNEEIDKAIKKMPNERAPGPDGFNMQFIKKCWHIIKPDFYQLCHDFFNEEVSMQAINNSFITLIPKG